MGYSSSDGKNSVSSYTSYGDGKNSCDSKNSVSSYSGSYNTSTSSNSLTSTLKGSLTLFGRLETLIAKKEVLESEIRDTTAKLEESFKTASTDPYFAKIKQYLNGGKIKS